MFINTKYHVRDTLAIVKNIFRKETRTIHYVFIVLIFLLLSAGQMISLVGGKQVLENVIISVISKDGSPTQNIKRFMQLTRAGNYNFITFQNGDPNTWKIEGVFIKKLFIGAYPKDLVNSTIVTITIGGKEFAFSGKEMAHWKTPDKSNFIADLQDVDIARYAIFEVPEEVSLSRSKIPLYSNFFGNILNWKGDEVLIIEPLKKAFIQTVLLVILTIFLRVFFIKKFTTTLEDISTGQEQKERVVLLIVSISISFFLLILLLLCIEKIYQPNIDVTLQQASTTYLPNFYKSFRPKPVERMQFVLGTLITPFLLLLSYIVLRNRQKFLHHLVQYHYQTILLVTNFIILAWFYCGMALTGFYFTSDSILSDHYWKYIYYFLVFPFFLHILFSKNISNIYTKWLAIVALSLTFFIIFCSNILPLEYNFQGLTFDPVLYPVSQVFAGKSLLVNLTCLYGLFPFFIVPLFKVIGLSTFKFTLFLAVLVCSSLFFVMKFMRLIIKNDALFLSGFLFVVFYTLLATRNTPELYYQYWPIRYIFPTFSLLLTAHYLRSENKALYYLSCIINGVAILWNFDVGLIVFLTWLVSLAYHEASKMTPWKNLALKILKHCIYALFGLGIVIGVFSTATFLHAGELPHWAMFFQFQKMFLSGYFMIKLVPFPHIWSFLLFIYGISLYIGIRALLEKKIGFDEKIIMALTSMGLGLFVYYEGQSSNVTLFRVWYPALILLVLFADMLLKNYKRAGKWTYLHYSIFSLLFLTFLSAPLSMIYNAKKYIAFVEHNVFTSYQEKNPILSNIDFLKQHTRPQEDVLILGNFKQAVYYSETSTRSAVDVPSLPDIFYPQEMKRLLDFLQTNKKIKIFVEQPLSSYDLYDLTIRKIIVSRYKEVGRSEYGMSMYAPQ